MSELVVKIAQISNLVEISDFLTNHFVNIEPTHASHVSKNEKLEPMPSNCIRDGIESQTSLMACFGDKLVGVLIAEEFKSHSEDFVSAVGHRSKDRDIMELLDFIEKKADLSNRFNLFNCLNIFLLSVHQDFLRQGIAAKLFEFCIENGKAKAFEAISVACTSCFTSRLAERFEMGCVSTVTYDEYNKHVGKIVFVPSEPHTKMQTFLKVY